MSTATIDSVVRMLDAVPDPVQEQAAEHLREFLADLEDERHWDSQFAGSQEWLAAEARRVRQAESNGLTEPMDISRL